MGTKQLCLSLVGFKIVFYYHAFYCILLYFQVIRINVYPNYNSSNYLGDIAILTLSSDAEFTNYVTPVCLWDERSDNLNDIVDKEGTVRFEKFTTFYDNIIVDGKQLGRRLFCIIKCSHNIVITSYL